MKSSPMSTGPGGSIRPTPSPGRQEPRLHPPRPVQIDTLSARHRQRPRNAADRHARPRHAGNLGGARHLSGHELDAGQPLDRLLGRRHASIAIDVASREVRRHPVPRHRHPLRRGRGALFEGGRPRPVRREDGPLRPCQPGRPPRRLRSARPFVDQGYRRRRAAAADHAGDDEFELYPTWSRDGRQIAYVSWNDQEAGRVKVVSATGGTGKSVTPEPGHYLEPAFSPDGQHRRLSQDQRRLSDHAVVGPRSRPLRGRLARRHAQASLEGRHDAAIRRDRRPAVLHGQRSRGQAFAALGRA